MWTPPTPPDEATGDAWATLENRLRREQPIDEPITDSSEDIDNFADNIAFPDEPTDELTYELDADEPTAEFSQAEVSPQVTFSTASPTITPRPTTASITSSPPPPPDAGHSPETEPNFNETLTEFDVSPDIENLRKPKIVPDEPAPKAALHGFGGAYRAWSFPTASGASSYAPKDAKQ